MRETEFLSQSRFSKLGRLPRMTHDNLVKPHYDIIYKSVVRKSNCNLMTMEVFFEALQELETKFTYSEERHENFTALIEHILTCLSK